MPDQDDADRELPPTNGDPVAGNQSDGDEIAASNSTTPTAIGERVQAMIYHQVTPPQNDQQRRNRRAMLQMMRNFWIKGVLEQSLHRAALHMLGQEQRPDTGTRPWNLFVQPIHQASHPLPPSTRIVEMFDAFSGALLILGASGSGKTTILLELARDLLDRADQDARHPIPVVFNLSSWVARRRPLTYWLADELIERYDIPRPIAQAWIDTNQILPLLDGLDFAQVEQREACIGAINAFRVAHRREGMAVCSSISDDEALIARLRLQGAIMVRPLTDVQIDTYLANAGEQLAGLHAALALDAELRELATSPLMLNVMTLAYQNQPSAALTIVRTLEARRRQMFVAYIAAMFGRTGTKSRYTSDQTVQWLTWLAQRMTQHSQTVFYIERMQPDWVATIWQHRVVTLGTALGIGLVSGLDVGLLGKLLNGPSIGLQVGLFGGLGGMLGGLIVLIANRTKIRPAEQIHWSWDTCYRAWRRALSIGLLGAVVGGVLVGLISALSSGGLVGLAAGLAFGLVTGLPCGLAIALCFELVFRLLGRLVFQLLGKLFDRLTITKMPVKTGPNQGMWRSARRAVLGGMVAGWVGGFVSGLFPVLFLLVTSGLSGRPDWLANRVSGALDWLYLGLYLGLFLGSSIGLAGALLGGLLGGFALGGVACIQHLFLRLILWFSGAMPWNYARFLDFAAERIFLRKVGGGYIFVHRLLLEYFASLETNNT